ncbi:MAG: SDR family NAD(P)-dependent oxidoreductase [Acidobacteriota bacterium]|jgi:NAD(P)-dependent dehydrogenase (short-subunit alcohol dehydrogenase family)
MLPEDGLDATNRNRRLAVVTGGNRGLGRETCRQLATAGLHVVLTARVLEEAAAAAASIGADPLPLDVTDKTSVRLAADVLRERPGTVDVLVNNAGIALDGFDARVARRTIDVNVLGAMAVTDALRPLLSPAASIVMVSSGMGELTCLSPELRRRFEDPTLSREGLVALLEAFVRDVEAGTYASRGWPGSAYRVSKAGLNAFTRILARELGNTAIRVNAVCPGWVRTDMGGADADRSVEEGARSVVWAALLGPGGPTGGFFRDGSPIPW